METKDNIELRSEKVRNIIGQIPPVIVRIGVTIILIAFIGLFCGAYFIKLDHRIEAKAELISFENNATINLLIPSNQIEWIENGQKVSINLSSINYVTDLEIDCYINNIPKDVLLSSEGGYYITEVTPTNKNWYTNNRFKVLDKVLVDAEIHAEKITLFEKVRK